jgi:hypothetical protein
MMACFEIRTVINHIAMNHVAMNHVESGSDHVDQ